MKDTIENHYKNLLIGAEDWAIQHVETEITCLERENAALREDKERMDWLADGDTYGKLASVRGWMPISGYPTETANDCIRAAIDAARAAQGGAE